MPEDARWFDHDKFVNIWYVNTKSLYQYLSVEADNFVPSPYLKTLQDIGNLSRFILYVTGFRFDDMSWTNITKCTNTFTVIYSFFCEPSAI